MFEKTINTLKDITGIKTLSNSYMGSNNDPVSPPDQLHEEIQTRMKEVSIPGGYGSWDRVDETDNAHVTEDAKPSSSRDKTDLNLHKSSVAVRQESHKPDARTRAEQGLSTNNRYRDENASLRTQLEASQRDLVQVKQQSVESQKRLMGEKEELVQKKKEAERQNRELQAKNQKLEEELKMLKGNMRGAQEKQLHTAKLLEERTADLKGAQIFLTTADRYGGAEIMKMVEGLNAEIFQGAALISELLGDETMMLKVDGHKKEAKVAKSAKDTLARCIGPALVEHLSTEVKQVQMDPLPLQLGVQALLTNWCVFMIDYFRAGPASHDLKEIYRRIWESEPQAVAGRWRAMTMGQAKHLGSTTCKENVVIELLFSLLRLCGIPMATLNSQKTGLCLRQVVSTIMDMWMQLRNAIHEGITTSEMMVFDGHANDVYHDAMMNDIYADTEDVQKPGSRKEAKHILCAVGMGLQRFVIKRNGDGTMFLQRDIILKAKVVFASVLFDAA